MDKKVRLLVAIIVFGLTIGQAFGTTVTFDKNLDVPDETFTVTDINNVPFSFTIDNIGNYNFGDDVIINVNGGVDDMGLVVWNVNEIATEWESFFNTGGHVSKTIPADRFDPNCPDVCDDVNGYKMGPGIYALAVIDYTTKNYLTAKPFIISEYNLAVTPNKTQAKPGTSIKITVKITKSGNPVDVGNNVEVKFVQDSTNAYFGEYATKISTGTYEANIQIPTTATGTYLLYAVITTDNHIYLDYPEILGAGSYGSTLIFTHNLPDSNIDAVTVEPHDNIAKVEEHEKDIFANKPVTYTFTAPEHGIYEIDVIGSINEYDTTLKVESLKDTSQLVSAPPSETVYKNINLVASTKRIKAAIIRFTVENSWLDSNKVVSVKMVRWDGSKWVQLDTTETTKDTEYTSYEANTGGFSSFAIVGLKEELIPTNPEATTKPTAVTTPAGEITPAPEATEEKKSFLPGFEVFTAILAVAGALYIKNKKRRN